MWLKRILKRATSRPMIRGISLGNLSLTKAGHIHRQLSCCRRTSLVSGNCGTVFRPRMYRRGIATDEEAGFGPAFLLSANR